MRGRRAISVFAGGVALAAAMVVPVVTDAAPSQVREFEHMVSRTLGSDLVYALYLRPDYDESDRRYPALYLLHGIDGNHQEWLHLDRFEFFKRLREVGLPVEMRMTTDDHERETWVAELADALVFFGDQFRRRH